MKFLTTSQTPLYKVGSNGFYAFVRSIASGTEVTVMSTAFDAKSDRPIGYLPTGEIIYLDNLVKVLDEVEVKDTRLWDWLLYIGLAVGTIYYITKD